MNRVYKSSRQPIKFGVGAWQTKAGSDAVEETNDQPSLANEAPICHTSIVKPVTNHVSFTVSVGPVSLLDKVGTVHGKPFRAFGRAWSLEVAVYAKQTVEVFIICESEDGSATDTECRVSLTNHCGLDEYDKEGPIEYTVLKAIATTLPAAGMTTSSWMTCSTSPSATVRTTASPSR